MSGVTVGLSFRRSHAVWLTSTIGKATARKIGTPSSGKHVPRPGELVEERGDARAAHCDQQQPCRRSGRPQLADPHLGGVLDRVVGFPMLHAPVITSRMVAFRLAAQAAL